MTGVRRGLIGRSLIGRSLVSVAAATALLGAATVPAVMLAPVAAAHSVLISVDPQDGSELDVSPEQVVLTFNEEINQNFVTVAVTSADDTTNRVVGETTAAGDTVTAQIDELEPGNYTVGYRVTSADGHVVSGSSVFSVVGTDDGARAEADGAEASGAATSENGGAAPAQTGADGAEAPGATTSENGGVNPAIWIVGGLAIVLIGGAFFLLRRGD